VVNGQLVTLLALPLSQPHDGLAECQGFTLRIGGQERGLVENHHGVVERRAILLEPVGSPAPRRAKTHSAARNAAPSRADNDSGNRLTRIWATHVLDTGSTETEGFAARPNEAEGSGEDQTGIATAELKDLPRLGRRAAAMKAGMKIVILRVEMDEDPRPPRRHTLERRLRRIDAVGEDEEIVVPADLRRDLERRLDLGGFLGEFQEFAASR
jgi:hypothetical protein